MPAATVQIASGGVQGADDGGTHAFKGIPYAAPPVGAKRLRPPQPVEPWDGVRPATDYGLVALQQPMPGIFGELGTPQNPAGDDCLNLNVWTPDPGASGLPVLVWIHGGAFYAGSGIDDVYNGASFASNGVVCVTINYRLGVQGFWHLGEHFADLSDSGNLGMLDQIAALRWVQENIAAFGGDPNQVTIAGESAGGMSVSTLMAMPAARGLFHRAIPQSGAASNGISAPTATMIAGHMLDMLGVEPGDLDALERVPSELMLQTQQKLGDELAETRDPNRFGEAAASAMAFQPTYGTEALPEIPLAAIAGGSASDIDVMIGTTMEEALIFLVDLKEMFNEELVTATMDGVFGMAGKDGSAALAVYQQRLPGAEYHELVAAIETDRMFTVPAIRMADAQAGHNANIWMYRFDWRTPAAGGAWGAHHFLEVPFAFNMLDNPQAQGFVGDDPPQALADKVHAAWVSFVKGGDPNNDALPTWPRYEPADRPTMLLDETPAVVNRPDDERVALWDGVI
ncbi:MAG: carboxylesterase/lipase family protein [Acidimicrobiia bacterium]|nr:carboxylesterase/lipase family protein [Acidimicrobiia bacterium]